MSKDSAWCRGRGAAAPWREKRRPGWGTEMSTSARTEAPAAPYLPCAAGVTSGLSPRSAVVKKGRRPDCPPGGGQGREMVSARTEAAAPYSPCAACVTDCRGAVRVGAPCGLARPAKTGRPGWGGRLGPRTASRGHCSLLTPSTKGAMLAHRSPRLYSPMAATHAARAVVKRPPPANAGRAAASCFPLLPPRGNVVTRRPQHLTRHARPASLATIPGGHVARAAVTRNSRRRMDPRQG
jgi:hypothetical protein